MQRKIANQRASLDEAVRRRDGAASSLDAMGPIGRRIHRHEREHLERNHGNAVREIGRAERKLAELADDANQLATAVPVRKAWERAHASDLERVRTLSRTITEHRVEAVIERSVTVDREVDLGISI